MDVVKCVVRSDARQTEGGNFNDRHFAAHKYEHPFDPEQHRFPLEPNRQEHLHRGDYMLVNGVCDATAEE